MRRLVLIGRSECGKTTLKQVLRGEKITYVKTQYVSQYDVLIDMPGEYAENLDLAHAIDCYTAEADLVALCLSATEPYSLYPPNVAPYAHRDIVGVVTKIDHWAADPEQAVRWLELCGCKKIFLVSAYSGEGIDELIDYLKIKHEKKSIGDIMQEVNTEKFGKLSEYPGYYLV
ncbi:MAG: EutP/PduV family microcompartment system protein [Eubacteriales bacterium]|nr:EutP/PduV family microcompartment system protein [Eubacteriales bacterium]